jgi:excisionase family DNA binding protein
LAFAGHGWLHGLLIEVEKMDNDQPSKISTPLPLIPLLLRDRDVAQLLGISRSFVWKLAATGELPAPVRVGGRTARWEREKIVAYVERLTGEVSR